LEITLNLSNVTAPINNYSDPIEIKAGESITINGYNAWPTWVEIDVGWGNGNPNLKTFIANLTNAYGRIGSYIHDYIENIVVKGGMTNPEHLISAGIDTELLVSGLRISSLKTIDLSEYDNASGTTKITTIDGAVYNDNVTTVKGSKTKDEIEIGSKNLKLVDSGKGDDKVTFTITQTKDITVNLGEGNDTVTTAALTANKKFEISGGAGNDKFKLAASTTTDNTASKYVTITDASRGDKIGLSDSVTGFVKTNANATSGQTDLKDAINAALASQGTTTANNIYAVYYGNETYLVRDADAGKTLSAGDNLVKLAGLSNYDVLNGNVITDTDGVTKLLEITNA